MGKYQTYPEYKDSGVDWLGAVPGHWDMQRFKYLFRISTEKNGQHVVGEMLSVSGYRGIEVKEYEDEAKRRTEEELTDYRVVRKGQLVVNTMWLNYAGLGVSNFEGYVSPAYRSYWMDQSLDGRFIHNLLRSSCYVAGYTRYMQGIRPNSLQIKTDDFACFPVLLPPSDEQIQIAAFLDRETAKIDRLIAKQEALIELLKEKRQAVISHAVTKGLDPDALMKDSGVEWLGEIPAHWRVVRVKQVCSFITSGPRGWSDFIMDEGSIFLQSGDLNDELGVDFEGAKRVQAPDGAEGVRTALNDGDAVVCITGAKTGRVAVAGHVPEQTFINQHLALLRPIHLSISSTFLALSLASHFGQSYFKVTQYGLKQGLSLENVAEAVVVLPPLEEQILIERRVKTKTSRLDDLVEKCLDARLLLQERRTALISAAVTGKIDVREEVA